MFHYFDLTGDRRFLARVPEAIAWLRTCPLPPDAAQRNPLLGPPRTHPTFIQLGTNDAIYVHRYGSNIHNGAYYFNKDLLDTLSHYSAGREIDLDGPNGLERTYQRLAARTDAEIAERKARSPLFARQRRPLPQYFSVGGEVDFPHLFEGAVKTTQPVDEAQVVTLINELNANGGRWLTPVPEIVNPFIGDGPTTPFTGTAFMSKHVGDIHDTSPYPSDNPPDIEPYVSRPRPLYIVSSQFIARMGQLISYISPVTA